jgi:hypothetical protein
VVEASAARRKVAGSRPDEVNGFLFSVYLILPAALGPGDYSASKRNKYCPCGGGLENHRSPSSRKRRRKGNPVPVGITGPPYPWGV